MSTQGVAAKTKLRYFTWSDGTTIKEDWIAPFEKAHPDIQIEYETASWGTFFTKLLAYCVAGNPPDIIHMSVGYVNEWAAKGLLVDLQPYFNRDLNPRDFFMEPMSAMRYPTVDSGDLYSLPFGITVTSLFYNKSMFDTMGVAYPNSNWSWYDVRDVARRLVKDVNGDGQNDQWGFYPGYGYTNLDPVIHAFGGSVQIVRTMYTSKILRQ
jgi:multiple sugar transport system substrate-binding protein